MGSSLFTPAQIKRLQQIQSRVIECRQRTDSYRKMSLTEQDRDDLFDLLEYSLMSGQPPLRPASG